MLNFMNSDPANVLAAFGQSLAIIEFTPDGKILSANENFCRAMGYDLREIVGQHHRMFAELAYAQSPEYQAFWARLGSGEFVAGEFKRLAKGGREVWIQASYNAVKAGSGKVYKVVKIASDITAAKRTALEAIGKLSAVSRAQATIEFTVDGTILAANENFLNAVGYSLDEIRGRHHRIFMDPTEAQSPAYAEFWSRLGRGEFIADEFRRIGKGGREIHIQASYNPIFDENDRVIKVVKFATDITARVAAVQQLGASLRHLAGGDLQQRIDRAMTPALEPLRTNFNDSVAQLEETISAIVGAVGKMRVGLNEITVAAGDLSQRTEQQAASLEETVAALSQVTHGVNLTAQRADDARAVATVAQNEAERGGTVVAEAIEAMSHIEASSDKIGKIIGVINEIAFQTNLLALNAGVEAARAGEAGRGFAVVAQEVRGLAQRSAEAAKEIKDLIAMSSQQVAQGVSLVSASGQSLEQIVGQVSSVARLIAEMAHSAREEAVSLKEVSVAADQMDKMTQQNAAMVEETTAAAQSLLGETQELEELTGKFKTGGQARTHARESSAQRAPAVQTGSARPAQVVQLRTIRTAGGATSPVQVRSEWKEL
ncbi:methyl-accepting chemotaxis protein [Mangrovibrevibacter kandeliae]|uniref:methyl-accepting chemotaxis protein n=1 Tax=Mangrovibrevibacter kandeliae TaxID=2968473 RepID=UPI0029FF3D70|nr:PAS domain-containing methyl-accepting chemotaxis protein [Aurantimonas sp. MSK8Z-1]